jgi:hypothetical protein
MAQLVCMAFLDTSGLKKAIDDFKKSGYNICIMSEKCELCDREKPLTKHHLIPRAVHTKKRFINRFGKEEMRQRGIMVCKLCHDGIHDIIPDEKELAEDFNTKELLLADERIRKHIEWARKQK